MTEHTEKALASLAKAYPYLAQHASHIDGEFDNALSHIRRVLAREGIYAEIAAERAKQDKQWGGPAHDDTHEANDWRIYRWKFENIVMDLDDRWRDNAPTQRDALVKIAALAVAQIESLDRLVKT